MQRGAARFVTGNYERHSSVSAMLSELGWDRLERRRHNLRMVLFMKVVRGEVMVPTEHILQINQSKTRAGTRGLYKQIRTNTETYRQSFFPQVSKGLE